MGGKAGGLELGGRAKGDAFFPGRGDELHADREGSWRENRDRDDREADAREGLREEAEAGAQGDLAAGDGERVLADLGGGEGCCGDEEDVDVCGFERA